MSEQAEVFVDTRFASSLDLSEATLIRTEAIDPARPPFDDPEVYAAALRRAARTISAEGWPRPNLVTSESMRPMVLAEPKPVLQVAYPDSGLTDAHVQVLDRVAGEFPGVEFWALEIPR